MTASNWKIYIPTLFILMNILSTDMLKAQNAEEEIRRLRMLSNNARKANDIERICKLFTDNIIIVKGDSGELIGREIVKKYMAKLKTQSPDLYFERIPDKVIIGEGNKMAWEEGSWTGYNKDGPLVDYAGRYSMMWIKPTTVGR